MGASAIRSCCNPYGGHSAHRIRGIWLRRSLIDDPLLVLCI
jgi:hypothetical protein